VPKGADGSPSADLARVLTDPAWEVVELDAYHVAPLSRPEVVVRALLACVP